MSNIQNSPEEVWKSVKGFEPRFKVSNHGRLLSINGKYGGEKILTPHIGYQGYLQVMLRMKPYKLYTRMHCLVAEHFLEKPNTIERLEIDHIDSNRLNNNVTNLRWVTSSQHRKISIQKGEFDRKGSKHHNAKLVESDVLEARALYKTGKFTHQKLANIYGINRRHMGDILNGVNWAWLSP